MLKYKTMFAVILVVLLFIFFSDGKESAIDRVGKEPVAVTVAIASEEARLDEFWFMGTVAGMTSAIISSSYSDKVEAVYVENGQRVRAGDELFRTDSNELENNVCLAENEVRRATVNQENATVNYKRKQQLFEIGALSREVLETAEVQWRTSLTEVDNEQTKLQIAQKKLSDATVTSPVSGVVANKKLTLGQIVSAGEQVMTVEAIDSVYVVIQVEQQDIARMPLGMKAKVRVDAFPEKTFTGEVAVLNPVAGRENRLFEVKILVENPDFLLMPGMFAEVWIADSQSLNVLTVPRSAIISRKGQNYLYVVTAESLVQRKKVELGELLDDKIEILSGIAQGDKIVVDNISKLKDGDSVKVHGGDGG